MSPDLVSLIAAAMIRTSLIIGLGALAVSVAFSQLDGPLGVFAHMRSRASFLECPYCSSFWLCLGPWLYLGIRVYPWVLVPFGALASWGVVLAILSLSPPEKS